MFTTFLLKFLLLHKKMNKTTFDLPDNVGARLNVAL